MPPRFREPTKYPHQWGRFLICVHCGWSTEKALQRQPETMGVGPCLKRKVKVVFDRSVEER